MIFRLKAHLLKLSLPKSESYTFAVNMHFSKPFPMHNKITLLLLFVASTAFASTKTITQTQKDYTTIKLWGFLKYYHSEVAKGKFDWDQQLFTIREKTKTAGDIESISKIYLSWIDRLGKVSICKSCSDKPKHEIFEKNFDLNWTQDTSLFSLELSAKLKFIEQNRHQGKSHYVDTHNGVGNVKFPGEKEYEKADWQDENMRLLSIARYWNQVEYFSPYKYMTDQKWNDVLKEMLPKILGADSEQSYHLAMLELVVKMDDSHANLITKITNGYFGYYWIPANYKIIDGKAIITGFRDESLAARNDLKIGDIIEKVNGESVADILKRQWKYINGSNDATKLRNTYYCLTNGPDDKVNLTIDRAGTISEKTVKRYLWNDFKPTQAAKTAWKLLDGNIGYVDMGNLKFDVKAIDDMMESLKKTDAIIFDIRNYPQSTLYPISRHLDRPNAPFVHFIQPDLGYPGKFYWRKTLNAGPNKNNPYRGKVILLVDESTQSHAEFTAMLFQTTNNCTTIGSQTAGADGNISEVIFPAKHKSYITGLGVFYPDGTETQRKGIRVDLEARPTINGISEGRDEVLEIALEFAKKE